MWNAKNTYQQWRFARTKRDWSLQNMLVSNAFFAARTQCLEANQLCEAEQVCVTGFIHQQEPVTHAWITWNDDSFVSRDAREPRASYNKSYGTPLGRNDIHHVLTVAQVTGGCRITHENLDFISIWGSCKTKIWEIVIQIICSCLASIHCFPIGFSAQAR